MLILTEEESIEMLAGACVEDCCFRSCSGEEAGGGAAGGAPTPTLGLHVGGGPDNVIQLWL